MIPEFKKGEFYVGLRNGILALEKQIKKEPLPQPAQEEAITMNMSSGGLLSITGFSLMLRQLKKRCDEGTLVKPHNWEV